MGAGLIALEAREWVFTAPGSTDNLSLLIWQSLAPTITANFSARSLDGWTIDVDGQIAGFGDSYMQDYDWIAPNNTGFGPDDWSDRSQHPDTALEWYLNGSLKVGNNVFMTGNSTVNLNAGLELTSTSWTASGGSAIYSDGGFRNVELDFTEGEPGITYRQLFPEIFAGVDGTMQEGPWQLSGGAKAGVTMMATATDIHWLRDRRFEETIDPALVLAANARLAYQVEDGMQVFVAGQIDNIFLGRSDTVIYEHSTGAEVFDSPDASGAQLFSATFTAGLTGSF